jgi:hypothetical protein
MVEAWQKVDPTLRFPLDQVLDDLFQGPARAADRERATQDDIAEANRKALLGTPASQGSQRLAASYAEDSKLSWQEQNKLINYTYIRNVHALRQVELNRLMEQSGLTRAEAVEQLKAAKPAMPTGSLPPGATTTPQEPPAPGPTARRAAK